METAVTTNITGLSPEELTSWAAVNEYNRGNLATKYKSLISSLSSASFPEGVVNSFRDDYNMRREKNPVFDHYAEKPERMREAVDELLGYLRLGSIPFLLRGEQPEYNYKVAELVLGMGEFVPSYHFYGLFSLQIHDESLREIGDKTGKAALTGAIVMPIIGLISPLGVTPAVASGIGAGLLGVVGGLSALVNSETTSELKNTLNQQHAIAQNFIDSARYKGFLE